MEHQTLIITQQEIEKALTLNDYISIIEEAHARHARQEVFEPNLLHADVQEGEFHIKTGGFIYPEEQYYGVKLNGGFPNNKQHYHLPNILGVIYICNAQNGYPLAIMDSVTISRMRTGAATAVAAKYLAPAGKNNLGIIGYGAQAAIQLKALLKVCDIHEIRIGGRDPEKAKIFAQRLESQLCRPIFQDSIENTARKSNILVTATPAHQYYLRKEWITPGTFIAAIGADSPGKQELEPELVASSIIVADIKKQVCQVGESQHAIRQGLITPNDIYAEIGEIITKQKKCPDHHRTIIYDSTGTALQDLGVGIAIYHLLKKKGCRKIALMNDER